MGIQMFVSFIASICFTTLLLVGSSLADVIAPTPTVDPQLHRTYCDVSNLSGWATYYCERQSDPESYVVGYPGGIAQEGAINVPKTAGVRWDVLCCPRGQVGTGLCGINEQRCRTPARPTPTPHPVAVPPEVNQAVLTYTDAFISVWFGDCLSRAGAISSYFTAYCRYLQVAQVIHQRGACLMHAERMCAPGSAYMKSLGSAPICNFVSGVFDETVASQSCYTQAQVGCMLCEY